jgi:hypothetical protein
MELALAQTEANAFVPLIQNQKGDDLFADFKLDLIRNLDSFVANGAAAVDDGQQVGRESAFPGFADVKLDLRKDSAFCSSFARFAQDFSGDDEFGFLRHLRDGHCSHFNGMQGGCQEAESKGKQTTPCQIHDGVTIAEARGKINTKCSNGVASGYYSLAIKRTIIDFARDNARSLKLF